jgi:acyl carrier protein
MHDGSSVQSPGQVIADIVARMQLAAGRAPVGPADNLRKAGFSSMDLVTLMLSVEDAFGIELPQEKMTPDSFRSIEAIEALVASLA